MSFRAEILADSIGPHKHRLTTFEVTFPRMVLADMTRHRVLSYSFESTRAVPTEKRIDQVEANPYVPTFMRRATGMGGGEPLSPEEQETARSLWLESCAMTIKYARELLWTNKEHVGRILEPYSWITGIVSGTEWDNFFSLRCPPPGEKPDPVWPAQFELQRIAHMMEDLYLSSVPNKLCLGEWHLPLVTEEEKQELPAFEAAKVSAGRCASVSYLRHRDSNNDTSSALKRWDTRLVPPAHWSPGEHTAMCSRANRLWLLLTRSKPSNYRGWKQLRKFYPNEDVRPRTIRG